VNMEETEASAFLAPEFAPAVPRDLCTYCGTLRTHERAGCACQFIKPDDQQMGEHTDGRTRNPSKPLERFLGLFRRMMRAARTSVETKALQFLLHLKAQRPRPVRHMIPQEIWHHATPRLRMPNADESSMRDEEMLAIVQNS